MRLLIILILTLILSACQPTLIADKNSFSSLIEDAWIELNEPLTVAVEARRVFIQRGQVIHYSELDLYAVNCELEVHQLSDEKQIIQPDRFDIKQATKELSPFVMNSLLHIASLQMIASSPPDIKPAWIFYLHSEKQPEVRSLICRGVQNSEESANLPTVEEMQAALGDLISLHLDASTIQE